MICVARTLNEGDHRLEGSLNGTVAAIRAGGGKATAVAADISLEAACLPAGRAARAAYGRVDTLVNNAALNYYIPTADYPTSRWIKAFAVNVHAPFILSRRGGGIGPGRGPYADQTVRGGVMYGATKAAGGGKGGGEGRGGRGPRRPSAGQRTAGEGQRPRHL